MKPAVTDHQAGGQPTRPGAPPVEDLLDSDRGGREQGDGGKSDQPEAWKVARREQGWGGDEQPAEHQREGTEDRKDETQAWHGASPVLEESPGGGTRRT